MQPIEADPEDTREIVRAAQILYKAISKNNLPVAYVMEALQGLYAAKASELASYEVYCKKIDQHKQSFKKLWDDK